MKSNQFVISLGGSVAFLDGPDADFLKTFALLLRGEIRKGKRFVVIVGGGNLCRAYQQVGESIAPISEEEKDWVGIYVTRLNARLVMAILRDKAHPVLLDSRGKIKKFGHYPLIIGAGWEPGWSTDFCATQTAIDFKIPTVVNLGKPAYVYTANPDKDKTAIPLKAVTWNEYFKIIPSKWTPGMNAPFDPIAARLAKRKGIRVVVAGGRDLRNFQKILRGEKFEGTIISDP